MAALFTYGFVLDPRLARLLATVSAVEATADYLHLTYDAAKKLEAH